MVFREFALWLGAGVMGAGLACAADALHPEMKEAKKSQEAAIALPSGFAAPMSLAPLVEALQPAVVFVSVRQTVGKAQLELPQEMLPFFGPFFEMPEMPRQREGQGSGFVISADGYILTNHHVVEKADKVTVKLTDERELAAKVVGTDPRTDIALLKVESSQPLPFAKLGRSETLRVGDPVLAIGNPFGLSHTVTAGIVSAKGRFIGAGPYDDFIQTDASINPGNSGGPLFDMSGEVVGINTAIVRQGQGIGFAVPIDMVKDILEELKGNGRVSRGWIGVGLQKLDADLAQALGAEGLSGAVVREVYPDTPGADAGLENGDVIVKIDGRPVKDNEELVRTVGARKPGETLALEILRDGKARTLKLKLSERPDEEQLAKGVYRVPEDGGEGKTGKGDAKGNEKGNEKDATLSRLGVKVEAFEGRIKGKGKKGLRVVSVDDEGPAAEKLRKGDFILSVDKREVTTLAELEAALRKSGAVALLIVEREGVTTLVAVRKG